MRRGGRARLKASDSKSDRGVSPSGVQILSPPPNFTFRAFAGFVEQRGGVAEWPKVRHWKCRVRATVPWVRIPPPPPFLLTLAIRFRWAVLDGEVAVPCNPQSATAGLNSPLRAARVEGAGWDGVEGWAPRDGKCRTPPGPEGSNGKAPLPSAVGVPGRSGVRPAIAGRTFRGGGQG